MRDHSKIEGVIKNATENMIAAYDRGYKQGFKDGKVEQGSDDYKRGLEKAEKYYRKIVMDTKDGGLSIDVIRNIFDGVAYYSVISNYNIHEIIKKIDEYEKTKDTEIKVGDEVTDNEVGVGIVTEVSNSFCHVIWGDGSCGKTCIEGLKKTGRSFTTELSNMLSMIREDEQWHA